MKSLILYGSPTKLSNAHKLVTHGAKQEEYFVRVDTFHGDVGEALMKASPMDGEIILNTVPFPDEHRQ